MLNERNIVKNNFKTDASPKYASEEGSLKLLVVKTKFLAHFIAVTADVSKYFIKKASRYASKDTTGKNTT